MYCNIHYVLNQKIDSNQHISKIFLTRKPAFPRSAYNCTGVRKVNKEVWQKLLKLVNNSSSLSKGSRDRECVWISDLFILA